MVSRYANAIRALPQDCHTRHVLRRITDHGRQRSAIDVAADRMRDGRAGWPSTSSGPGGKGGISDPTFDRMLREDIGTEALVSLEWNISHSRTITVARIVDAWTPQPASARDRHETRYAIQLGCDHCQALGLPVDLARSNTPTNLAGRLPIALRLCQCHYDFGRNHNRLPTRAEHDQGQRHRPSRPRLVYTR